MEAKNNNILFLFLIVLAFTSCSRGSCPLSAGSGTMETRTVAGFNEIVLYDKINLILTQDSIQMVRVGAGKNLVPGIQTSVEDGILTISNGNGCNWLRDPGYQVSVYIHSNRLQKITCYGAGNIQSTNTLRSTEFTVDSWYGTGSVNLSLTTGAAFAYVRYNNAVISLSGQADSSFFYCGEEGSVNATNFISNYVSVDSKSIENMYVNVTASLQATIAYKGNVFFTGNPSVIDTLVAGSGRLIHLP